MNVRKFIAATTRDALRKVKETLGPDAIILSNRAIPGGVEIMAVAARDMEMIVPIPEPEAAPRGNESPSAVSVEAKPVRVAPPQSPQRAAAQTAGQQAAQQPSRPLPPPAARPLPPLVARPLPPLDASRAARASAAKPEAEVVPVAVIDEIRQLRRIVEQQLAGFAWGESARAEPVKTEMLRQMLDAGFSPRFARELLADLPHDLDAGQALGWVKGGADRSLLTINSETDIVDRGGVYALVGPTGVGKTTTTAKLAARCVLRHGARKLALVTTDGYRIGAHEQLRIYGRILGVSVHLARDAEDLRTTLTDLQHKHMVLIDTMGMSQRDRLVSEQVAMFGDSKVKSLLLSLGDESAAIRSMMSIKCLQRPAEPRWLHSDQGRRSRRALPSSLDVIIRQRLRLFYVSNGQRVPEDLHLPNRPYLVHRAFKDLPDSSPHRLAGLEPGLMMASAAANAAHTTKVVSAGGGQRA
jgi:flagellar biosynthesis protein FlhF